MRSSISAHETASVCGIVVTYHPALGLLEELLRVVRPQLNALVIVDNGSNFDFSPLLKDTDIQLVELGDNFGIAYAQNVGIERARIQDADFVLLMDQDSIPAADMVRRLIDGFDEATRRDPKVAAVGPSYLDSRQGEAAPFVYRDGLKLKRRDASDGTDIVEADFLIASGCLIPLAVVDTVGTMAEEMFIDYVDIEWGLRARESGYMSYGVMNAHMQHSLGDEWVTFRGRRLPVHSPLRHYYHVRNAVWLMRRPWLSGSWRIILGLRVMKQFFFFGFFVPNGWAHAKMMMQGIWHGIRNRMGRR